MAGPCAGQPFLLVSALVSALVPALVSAESNPTIAIMIICMISTAYKSGLDVFHTRTCVDI